MLNYSTGSLMMTGRSIHTVTTPWYLQQPEIQQQLREHFQARVEYARWLWANGLQATWQWPKSAMDCAIANALNHIHLVELGIIPG